MRKWEGYVRSDLLHSEGCTSEYISHFTLGYNKQHDKDLGSAALEQKEENTGMRGWEDYVKIRSKRRIGDTTRGQAFC